MGAGGASVRIEVAEEGGRPQRLVARLQEALVGSKVQYLGRRKEAAARVIGKLQCRVQLCMVLDQSEMTESRSQSIGRPKMVFTVTSEPRAKESYFGAESKILESVTQGPRAYCTLTWSMRRMCFLIV